AHHVVAEQDGGVRQRIDTTGQHQIRAAGLNGLHARVQRLHARSAVTHHGPAWHFVTCAQTQTQNPADIGFIGRGGGATQNDLAELRSLKGLAQQQLASCLYGQISSGEGAGRITRFQKRAARAVNNIDRLKTHTWLPLAASAAGFSRRRSKGKSSTAITRSRTISRAWICSYSWAVMPPAWKTASARSRTLALGLSCN